MMTSMQLHASEKSRAMTRYVRNAKANRTNVLCAIDMEMEGGNQCKVSSYLEHLALIKYGGRDIARLFMNGYFLAMLGVTRDLSELEELIYEDLYDAVKELGPQILKDANVILEHQKKVESERDYNREITRRDANKPIWEREGRCTSM